MAPLWGGRPDLDFKQMGNSGSMKKVPDLSGSATLLMTEILVRTGVGAPAPIKKGRFGTVPASQNGC